MRSEAAGGGGVCGERGEGRGERCYVGSEGGREGVREGGIGREGL